MTAYDDYAFGFSWLPDETMSRTAHALDTGDGVWLVDPVDVPEAIERAVALGPPAGVLQLLDRHSRDCAEIAARLGVPHLRLPAAIPGSPFAIVPVLRIPRWHEIALWWPERRALVVAELIGVGNVAEGNREERAIAWQAKPVSSAAARPACIRCSGCPRRGPCAATGRSTCSSATGLASTGRPPPRRSRPPTRARGRSCRGCSAGCPRWPRPRSPAAGPRRRRAARW